MLTERQVRWLRVGAVIALVALLLFVGSRTGLAEALSRDALRASVERAGMLGPPLFIGAFCLGLLFHVPATGILFVAIAVTLYGRMAGGLLAYAGAVVGVLASFVIVRGIGGRPLAAIKNKHARRILEKLEARPILTVVVLRVVFFAGAPVNYALALSTLRPRDYVVGSIVGLVAPIVPMVFFFDVLLS